MNQLLFKILFAGLLLWALAPEPQPSAQMQVSTGRVIVSQGGNDAVVTSAGALSGNVAQVGGTSISLGQSSMASSLPVAIASNQSALPQNLSQVGGSTIALGQTAMTGSLPVTVASNQSAIPQNVSQVGGAAVALGQTTMSASLPVVIASNQSALAQNVSQFGGTAVVTGTGVSGSGVPRVTVSNDSQVKPWDGANTITVKAASTTPVATDTALVVGVSPNTLGCVGQSIANTKKAAITQTASSQIVAGASGKQTYICSMVIFSATAQSVNLVEGTGTTCGTGTAGMTGGTTASTGMSFAANGSVSRGAGNGLVTFTATAADNVCLLQSSSGQVSGVLIYTQF